MDSRFNAGVAMAFTLSAQLDRIKEQEPDSAGALSLREQVKKQEYVLIV